MIHCLPRARGASCPFCQLSPSRGRMGRADWRLGWRYSLHKGIIYLCGRSRFLRSFLLVMAATRTSTAFDQGHPGRLRCPWSIFPSERTAQRVMPPPSRRHDITLHMFPHIFPCPRASRPGQHIKARSLIRSIEVVKRLGWVAGTPEELGVFRFLL